MAGSSNETVSHLQRLFAQTEISPEALDVLLEALGKFAVKHDDPDEVQSQKVQEELKRVYSEHVQTDGGKLGAFVASLTALVPYLNVTNDLSYWYDLVMSGLIHDQGNSKASVRATEEFVLACVDVDGDGSEAKQASSTGKQRITKLVEETLKCTASLLKGEVGPDVRAEHRTELQLEALVVEVGRRHPGELFSSLEKPLLDPDTRYIALQLTCAWLRHQHPHLDAVTATDVVDILLKCLMNDRSTVIVSGALRCLIMLLPHIPTTVSSELPRLFLVYSRCLCWEKFSSSTSKEQRDLVTDDRMMNGSGSDDEQGHEHFTTDPSWKVVNSVDNTPGAIVPELATYFTYLYGLYPLNFTSYIRKPRRYLKQIDFPGAEGFDLDRNIIHKRTEQFQRMHLLHPSFFHTTLEEELTDNRWLKAEPGEVVAECLGLNVDSSDAAVDRQHNSTSENADSSAASNFTMLQTNLPEEVCSVSGADTGTPASAMMMSVDSLIKSTPSLSADTGFLLRELLVVRNELHFERYLKQQHVAAIGQLKRERVKTLTVEAEMTSLYNTNKRLQKRLEDANKFNEKLQKETQARKTHSRHSEEQLTAKIRTLRAGLVDQAALKDRLTKAVDDIDTLRELLATSEAREAQAREKMEEQQQEIEKLRDALARHGDARGPEAALANRKLEPETEDNGRNHGGPTGSAPVALEEKTEQHLHAIQRSEDENGA